MKSRFFRITILLIALCLFLSAGSFVYADVTESTPEIGGVTEAVDSVAPGGGKEAGSDDDNKSEEAFVLGDIGAFPESDEPYPEGDARFEDKTWEQITEEFFVKRSINPDTVGIGYYNTVTGEEHYHKGDIYRNLASLYKVPLNMYYAEKVHNGEMTMDDVIGYISYGELQKYSIVYSNNEQSEILLEHTGTHEQYRSAIAAYLFPEDVEPDNTFITGNMVTPEQLVTCLRRLYNEPEKFPDVLDCMKQAEPENFFAFSERRYPIAHKYGSSMNDGYGLCTLNDMGIIYTDDPFILVMMTEWTTGSVQTLSEYCSLMCDYTMYKKAQRENESENSSIRDSEASAPPSDSNTCVSPAPDTEQNTPATDKAPVSTEYGTESQEKSKAPGKLLKTILIALFAACIFSAIALLIFGKNKSHRLIGGALILACCVTVLILLSLRRDKAETSPAPSSTSVETEMITPSQE